MNAKEEATIQLIMDWFTTLTTKKQEAIANQASNHCCPMQSLS
jgi:hypothetical protein